MSASSELAKVRSAETQRHSGYMHYEVLKGTQICLIKCPNCIKPMFKYQKNEKGPLERCYIEQILDSMPFKNNSLFCVHCNTIISNQIDYAEDKRLCFMLKVEFF